MAENKRNWIEQKLTIQANSTSEVAFNGSQGSLPNHFMINNLSAGDVYLGIKIIPNAQQYDLKVSGYSRQVTARDTAVNRIQIYNSSSNPADIILTTFYDEFRATVLAGGGSVNVSGGGGGGGTSFDGIIKGHTVPLPAGDNKIGKVDIVTMPAQTINFPSLPAGTNNIGDVDIASMPSLPAGNNTIGNVGVVGTVNIGSMPAVQVSNTPVKTSHEMFEKTVGTTEYVYDMSARGGVDTIVYIANDDTQNDLFISFDTVTATNTPTEGQNSVIRLKPGEVLNDIPRKTSKVHLIRSVNGGLARFLGV